MYRSTTTAIATAAAAAVVVALAALGTAAPAVAAGAVRDPSAPGCRLESITVDHVAGAVTWDASCSEGRWVIVDSTSFAGTPDDHVVVDHQETVRWVGPGTAWSGVQRFGTDGVDQIRSQVVTFRSPGDPTESPAIIGGATG